MERTGASESIGIGTCRFRWREAGSGPPLVLVHGWPLHGATWDAVLPRLARRATCIVPDLPGLGLTEWSDGTDFTFTAQAERLGRFIDTLGLDRYSLLAQDTGATIARLVAAAHGERVRELVLVNTELPGHRPPWIRLYQKAAALPGSRASFSLTLRSRAFLRSPLGFGGCFHDRSRIDDTFVDRYVTPLVREPRRREGALRVLRGIEWRVVDALGETHRKIRARTRLVWGAEDPTFPVERARAVVGDFREADLVEIPKARLLVHEERPDEVAAAVLDFLEAKGSRVGA